MRHETGRLHPTVASWIGSDTCIVHSDAVPAETQTMIAGPLLRTRRSVTIQARWISGLMVRLFRAFPAIHMLSP